MTTRWQFSEVLVSPQVREHPETRKILQRLGVDNPRLVSRQDVEQISASLRREPDPMALGKKTLWLTSDPGKKLQACPGTTKAYCCNYYVIEMVENCPYDCSYCFLQSYLNSPLLRINVNIEDYLAEMAQIIEAQPDKQFRIGSGELSDSLALESLTDHGKQLADFFSHYDNALLELKTKSAEVDSLLEVNAKGRTVVAWSMNPAKLSQLEEHDTASIEARLAAAQKVIQAGYKVAFHFDPIVLFPGWNFHYLELIEQIEASLDAESIAWVGLGALRFPKGLRQEMQKRFPESKLPLGEFVLGMDHKERYPQPFRADAYERLSRWMRRRWPNTPIFLCMESGAVWEKLTGGKPRSDDRLDTIFR